MDGDRIDQAKSALILFLKSLPENSQFNIVSFGSVFEKMYDDSVPYTDENIEKTIENIEDFEADFGGTEIGQPILHIMENISNKS